MNHVPDDVLAAIDDLGESLLVDEPTTVRGRLRSDFRLRIDCDRAALEECAATITFRLEHASREARLRDHGSYICTIVDNVEARLRQWGIEPPKAYTYRDTENGWHTYGGTLEL